MLRLAFAALAALACASPAFAQSGGFYSQGGSIYSPRGSDGYQWKETPSYQGYGFQYRPPTPMGQGQITCTTWGNQTFCN